MNKVNPNASEFEVDSVEATELPPIFQTVNKPEIAGMSKQTSQPKQMGPQKPAKRPGQKVDVASKQDLIELHNRVVKMFTTLNQGLVEMASTKAQQDREALTTQLDKVEQSINDMEGMLRIEMAPKLRAIVQEELEDQWVMTRSKSGGRVFKIVLLISAIAAGAVFADQLTVGLEFASDQFFSLKDNLVPIWGHWFGQESI